MGSFKINKHLKYVLNFKRIKRLDFSPKINFFYYKNKAQNNII